MSSDSAPLVVLEPTADHCIETVARAEYRRCVDSCLRSASVEPELASRVEILRLFLEQADFHRLRRESEPLITAGRRVLFVVRSDGETAVWRMEIVDARAEER